MGIERLQGRLQYLKGFFIHDFFFIFILKIHFISNRNFDDLFYLNDLFDYLFLAAGDSETVIQRLLIGLLRRFGNVVVTAQYYIQLGFRSWLGLFSFVRVDIGEPQSKHL